MAVVERQRESGRQRRGDLQSVRGGNLARIYSEPGANGSQRVTWRGDMKKGPARRSCRYVERGRRVRRCRGQDCGETSSGEQSPTAAPEGGFPPRKESFDCWTKGAHRHRCPQELFRIEASGAQGLVGAGCWRGADNPAVAA